MELSNIFPTFLQVNESLLNRRGTPAIAISSIPETKNSGEQADSARKFEETVDETQRQRWLEPQVRIAASLFLSWSFFFLVGLFGSMLFSQDVNGVRSPPRLLESVEEEYNSMPHGETAESSVDLIPFQVFNILRYEIGQRYNSHYDAINPAEYGPQTSQRIASFLLYLSDVEEGGETMFPFEHDLNIDTFNSRKCIGLKVKPRRGDGLLFYSVFPNGTIDWTSMHGSCPVIEGEKWVATKWIRDEQQED
ncbi:hypothetical protein PVL29_003321 [Vitis rotundifolia]|uniref:Fe2OG dioxygenase domain-containing protein n=1 Tax=Vitis rotundifolia TaxID=103349 RepID=A0AA39ACR5_VITRO|nr:hypothetical protein PVL29_003321 [Vitis rotundifolia]